jgi:hypothetical protein
MATEQSLEVRLPDELPTLTPAAARTLLRILVQLTPDYGKQPDNSRAGEASRLSDSV